MLIWILAAVTIVSVLSALGLCVLILHFLPHFMDGW